MDGPIKILRFGKKEIFLPKFTVALVRTPQLSPYHAKFQVPLNFSKFDLRDYLFHAYNVRTLSIKSSVKHQPVRAHPEILRHLFRPEAQKFMTVEMDRPFVWPEEPENWEPWGKAEKEQLEKDESDENEIWKQTKSKMREQARALLKGKEVGLNAWEKNRTSKIISGQEPKFKVRV